jgi:hypothetical protein
MKHTVFCGCSYVAGDGLESLSQDSHLWVNIVHANAPMLTQTTLINLGVSGFTNQDIFCTALASLTAFPQCAYLFVSWTNCKRLHVNPGVEIYDTGLYLENSDVPDVKLNPGHTIPGYYVQNIRDRFFDLTHNHYDLLEVLTFSTVIDLVARRQGTTCFFVNSLLNIDQGYFDHIVDPNRQPSQTTPLTQQFLQLETRNDTEFFALYDKIHQEYADTLGHTLNWLNLDRGYRKYFYVDTGADQLHPGPRSNQLFATHIIEKLEHFDDRR